MKIQEVVQELAPQGQIPEFTNDMALADEAKRAARYEDAAQIYEKWKLFDDAGSARRGAQARFVKQVTVDLNRILEQVRRDGLMIPFRCSNCGSSVRIGGDTQPSALETCAHCGTAYDKHAMVELLTKILG